MRINHKHSLWFLLSLLSITFASGQGSNLFGQDSTRNPITVAVPFLGFAPDSRGSALGDAGVASSADVFSTHWNNAKLSFIEEDMGGALGYSPWLAKIIDDMDLIYVTGFYKLDKVQTLGVSMRYFDMGEIQLTDNSGGNIGLDNPKEAAFDATYSRKLSENIGVGVTGRYIWSNLNSHITNSTGSKAGTSVAVDLGFYYTNEVVINAMNTEVSFGAHLSNFGRKITYSNDSNEDFIPTNLRIGSGIKMHIDPYNSITWLLDFNKLLVPTPPIYELDANGEFIYDNQGNRIIKEGKDPTRPLLSGTFGSFSDAPRGFKEEIQEIMISTGVEYKYQDVLAVRFGYFHEHKNKGNRQYFTAGVGFKYQILGLDFSYLIPRENDHPLGETLRVSLSFAMDNQ